MAFLSSKRFAYGLSPALGLKADFEVCHCFPRDEGVSLLVTFILSGGDLPFLRMPRGFAVWMRVGDIVVVAMEVFGTLHQRYRLSIR